MALRVVIGGSCRSASFRVVGPASVAFVAPLASLAVVVLGVLVGVLAGVLGGVLAWRDDVKQLADLVGKRFDGFLHVCRVRFGGLHLVVSSGGTEKSRIVPDCAGSCRIVPDRAGLCRFDTFFFSKKRAPHPQVISIIEMRTEGL